MSTDTKLPNKSKTKKSKADIARKNWEEFKDCDDTGHRDYVKRAKRNNDFYAGEQWDKADKERLEREGRPALTLNLILSTVNAMIGEQLDRKVDAIFSPDVGGDPNTANALNKITRCILNRECFDDKEEDVFQDGLITSRGFYDVRMNFDKNIQGQISITSDDPIDIIIDPEAKEYDPETWSRVFISKWMTPDAIAAEYGWEKLEEIRRRVDTTSHVSDDNFDYFDRTYGGRQKGKAHSAHDSSHVRRMRVIEQQYFVPHSQWFFVDLSTGDMRPVPFGADDEGMKVFAEQYGLGLVKRKGRRVRMTTTVDDVLLHDDWSIYRSFTIVPFFPYFRRGKPFSPVDNLIDPQKLVNKTSSQELHIVNTTANSGWVVEEGSLVDMEVEDLEERGAETGLVLQYRKNAKEPQKIQPNQIPTGIDRISQKAASTIREISSVNASMLGTARADQSGAAQREATQRGQVQVSVVLSNLKKARYCVIKKVLELVQDFYTETRYFAVAGDSVMMMQDQGEEVAINQPTDDGNILNDVTMGNYNIEIGFRAAGGTRQEQEFEEAMRLREMGVQIPDHVLIQYSSLSKRQEIAEFLKNTQGFGEQTEEQKMLEDMQMEHQIQMLKREVEKVDSEIELSMAKAKETMAKAVSLEGFNQMNLELQKLQQAKEQKQQELSLRIALAARSHQNSAVTNDKRLASQIAMKGMDIAANAQKPKPKTDKA